MRELGSSIDSLSISCSDTHTAIAVASHHYRTFSDRLLSSIVLLVATDGCKWERRNILPQCESKVLVWCFFLLYCWIMTAIVCVQIMKVALFPFEGDNQSPFAFLYSTSGGLNFCTLTSAPTSVLASAADKGPSSTHITCFDSSPTTIACGTSAFGYQVCTYILLFIELKYIFFPDSAVWSSLACLQGLSTRAWAACLLPWHSLCTSEHVSEWVGWQTGEGVWLSPLSSFSDTQWA